MEGAFKVPGSCRCDTADEVKRPGQDMRNRSVAARDAELRRQRATVSEADFPSRDFH